MYHRLAHHSGLFYEDEYEITTASVAAIALPNDDWYERKKTSFLMLQSKSSNSPTVPAGVTSDNKDGVPAAAIVDDIPPQLLEMLREQCMVMFGNCPASRFTGDFAVARFVLTLRFIVVIYSATILIT